MPPQNGFLENKNNPLSASTVVTVTTAYHCRKVRHACRGEHSVAAVLALFQKGKKMYHIRFNSEGKRIMTETVTICGLSGISELIRKCANFAAKGRLTLDADGWVNITRKNGNVVKLLIPRIYYKKANEMITVDGLEKLPEEIGNQQEFRQMVIAQCLDLQAQCRTEWERKRIMDAELQSAMAGA